MSVAVWLVHEVRDYGADTVYVFASQESADAFVQDNDPGLKCETPYLSKYEPAYRAVVE